MLVNSQLFVGLWFVPVVLFILIPLAMLSIWTIIQVTRKIHRKVEQLEDSVLKTKENAYGYEFEVKSIT